MYNNGSRVYKFNAQHNFNTRKSLKHNIYIGYFS